MHKNGTDSELTKGSSENVLLSYHSYKITGQQFWFGSSMASCLTASNTLVVRLSGSQFFDKFPGQACLRGLDTFLFGDGLGIGQCFGILLGNSKLLVSVADDFFLRLLVPFLVVTIMNGKGR